MQLVVLLMCTVMDVDDCTCALEDTDCVYRNGCC
jgi:hypothetical protein